MSIKKITVSDPFLRLGCHLGEGPIYDYDTNTLHFVDILEKQVFHLDPATKQYTIEQFDVPITCLAVRSNGRGLACCTSKGFATIEEGKISYLSSPLTPRELEYSRFNDGACDSNGVFFAGTLFHKETGLPGQLYRFDPRTNESSVVDPGPFTDSNGLAWSPDEKTLYFTDSKVNIIYAYDYADGAISNRRVHIDGNKLDTTESGHADGLAVDVDGCIWSARWGGSKIIRYTVDGKGIDLEIEFPKVYKVTALCFGGPNDDQLYVTTARANAVEGDPALQDKYPDSGHLFHVDLSGQYKGLRRAKFTR